MESIASYRATAIRNDGDLTAEARLKHFAVDYLRAKHETDDHRESSQGTSASQASTIDRDVSGGAHVIGGDEVRARAAAQLAYDQRGPFDPGWLDVVDAFSSRRPEVGHKLEALAAAQRDHLGASIEFAFVFAIFKPTELERYSDYRLCIVAEGHPHSAGPAGVW
jgi:hypothetical protein